VHVLGTRGLRNGDVFDKSEVFVEASIAGKPGSATKTGLAVSSEDDAVAKSIKAVFDTELEVKEYALGDAVTFVVKDKDMLNDDVLGRAVLSEEQLRSGFEGELALAEAVSEGQAFLRVKVEAQETVAEFVMETAEVAGSVLCCC